MQCPNQQYNAAPKKHEVLALRWGLQQGEVRVGLSRVVATFSRRSGRFDGQPACPGFLALQVPTSFGDFRTCWGRLSAFLNTIALLHP